MGCLSAAEPCRYVFFNHLGQHLSPVGGALHCCALSGTGAEPPPDRGETPLPFQPPRSFHSAFQRVFPRPEQTGTRPQDPRVDVPGAAVGREGKAGDGTGRPRSPGGAARPLARAGRGGGAAERGAGSGAAEAPPLLLPRLDGTGVAPGRSVEQRELSLSSSSSSASPPLPAPRGGYALPGPPGREVLRGRADKGCGLVPALGRDGAARRLRRLGGASRAEPGRTGRERHMVRGWCPALRTRGRSEGPPWTTSWRR